MRDLASPASWRERGREEMGLRRHARRGRGRLHVPAAALRDERDAGNQSALGADLRRLRRRACLQASQPLIGKLCHARRQGPHLQEPLRPPRLGPRGRAAPRRLGRHQGDHRQGPRLDHQRDEGVGPARPRRRGLPDRPEMVVHAEGIHGRPAELSRGQCRRVRARHLQGSRDHAARSASPGRGLPARELRDGRACLLHLCARRVHPRARASAGRGRSGL